ncbi:MAG: hypothetical protein JWP91_2159 [Fibrobacteres bacterium]|nr:hypothetical protein [Fibrobacterota bacterium]
MKHNALRIAAMALGLANLAHAAPQAVNVLSEVEEAQGFVSLFDGTLGSFNSHFVNYRKLDSTNVVLPPDWKIDPALGAVTTDASQNSDIRSTVKYADFDLRFDYRNDGDGGVYYRFNLNDPSPWYSGIEYAIFDDYDNCKTCAGAALELYGPQPLIYRPFATKAWNNGRIVVVGDSVEHWLNGEKVLGFKYHSADFWNRFEASKWATTNLTFKTPGNKWGGYIEKGYVGFQALTKGHWQLRHIRINPVSPKPGYDKWWSTTASTTTGIAARKPSLLTQAGHKAFEHGALIYRTPAGSAIKADGRINLP